MRYLIILLILLTGCKAKQVEKITSIKSDTLIVKQKIIETPPILSRLTINEICDTITSKPKEFTQQVIVGADTVFVEVKDNRLSIAMSKLKAITLKQDSLYRSIKDHKVSTTLITEYKTPKWAWFVLIALIVSFVFPSIPTFINKSVKRIISFFKGVQ